MNAAEPVRDWLVELIHLDCENAACETVEVRLVEGQSFEITDTGEDTGNPSGHYLVSVAYVGPLVRPDGPETAQGGLIGQGPY